MSRSCQRHLKVKQAKILNKKHFLHFFVTKVFSTRLQLLWLGIFPERILGGTVNIIWLGGVIPHSYIPPSPLISHPLPTLKPMQKIVNWRLVEHSLKVTKHLRQPHLGTKGDMVWGCPLLGLYYRVRSRSYQGYCKVKPAIQLNKTIFLQFPYFFFVAKECSTRLQLT